MQDVITQAINAAGPRLRELRRDRELTLEEVAEQTGISRSTLSRLESGGRKASLELLLPLARAYGVTLDQLVDAPFTGDPRVSMRPAHHGDRTVIPLTRRPGGLQAYKVVLHPTPGSMRPQPRTHTGYEWLYVLDGRLRLILGDHDIVMPAGEAAEFDTRLPHWFGPAGDEAVEILSLFGKQGERAHLRAAPPRHADS